MGPADLIGAQRRAWYELRLVGADPGHNPVVFASAVEGLRRAFSKRLTPQLRSDCKALGIDFERVQPAYALTTWLAVLDRLATDVVPGAVGRDAQYRQLGQAFMYGFVETPIGMALYATAKVVGPKRALLRMGRNFRSAANYIDVEAFEMGPTQVDIRTSIDPPFREAVRPVFGALAPYRQGVLEATTVILGLEAEVRVLQTDVEATAIRFQVTWR